MIAVNIFAFTVKLGIAGGRKQEIKDDFITEHASKRNVCVQLPRKALKHAQNIF